MKDSTPYPRSAAAVPADLTGLSSKVRHFASNSPIFRKACGLAGLPPSYRQASKFINQRGLAYARRFEAHRLLTEQSSGTV